MKTLSILFIISISFLASCSKKTSTESNSIIFWKTTIGFDSTEVKLFRTLNIKHIYVKYFEVDWNAIEKKALPLATITIYNPPAIPVTPCVYITNNVLIQSNDSQIIDLAEKIIKKINHVHEYYAQMVAETKANEILNADTTVNPNEYSQKADSLKQIYAPEWLSQNTEILIDCDWTVSTQQKYFTLLEHLKKAASNKQISSTLRLWQYKYQEKAGIPPVDKCLLMCYSVNNPTDYLPSNSISSLDDLKKYIGGNSYPKKLDIALPLFSWSLIFRNKQFKGIVRDLNETTAQSNSDLFRPLGEHLYQFKTDTVIGNMYIRYGDELKTEQLSADEMENIIHYISKSLNIEKDTRITYFSWDTIYFNQYGTEKIKEFYRMLH